MRIERSFVVPFAGTIAEFEFASFCLVSRVAVSTLTGC